MNARGFTIVESLLVVAMLLIILAMTAPLLSGELLTRSLGNYAADAVDAVREAQAATMNGRNAGSGAGYGKYGVHFESTKFVFFEGATYGGAVDTTVHSLTGNVTITAVSLSPGGSCTVASGTGNCDVHFASRLGTPTETGTITLSEIGGTTKTVTINSVGMTDAN